MSALEMVAERQAIWSATANKLRAGINRARWAIFVISVLGAFLATVACVQLTPAPGSLAEASADPLPLNAETLSPTRNASPGIPLTF
jgi:uncharacterized protein (DUF1810 family)